MSRIKHLKKEAHVVLPTSGESYVAEDGTVSVVMDDHYDPGYEPSEKEINDYAEWLGMKLPEDEELMWIAKEGLRAPLPKEWKPCKTDTEEVYYFNFKTGESIWDHPLDEYFKGKYKQEKEKLKKEKLEGGPKKDRLKLNRETDRVMIGAASPIAPTPVTATAPTPTAVASPVTAVASQRQSAAAQPSTVTSGGAAPRGVAAVDAPATKTTVAAVSAANSILLRKTPPDETVPNVSTPLTASGSNNSFGASPSTGGFTQPPAGGGSGAAGTSRLLTEADKLRLERLRHDLESAHVAQKGLLEDTMQSKLSQLHATHLQQMNELRQRAETNKKLAAQLSDDRAASQLEEAQRELERKFTAQIRSLESEIDVLRERVREQKNATLKEVAGRIQQIDADVRAKVADRVAAVEGEIADLRRAHAAAQRDRLERSIATAAERSDDDVKNAVAQVVSDFERQCAQAADQHHVAVQRLRREHDADMEALKQRRQAALSGMSQQLLDTLSAQRDGQLASLKASFEQDMRRIEQDHRVRMDAHLADRERQRRDARRFREENVSLLNQGRRAAARQQLQRSLEERLSQARARAQDDWADASRRLEADRQHQLQAADQLDAGVANGEATARDMELIDELRRGHERAMDMKRAELQAQRAAFEKETEREREAAAQALASRTAAAKQASDQAFQQYVSVQTAALDAEDSRARAAQQLELDSLREQTNTKPSTSSASVVSNTPQRSLQDAIARATQAVMDEASASLAAAQREARQRRAAATQRAILALADELAETESRLRKSINDVAAAESVDSSQSSPTRAAVGEEASPIPHPALVIPSAAEVDAAAAPLLEALRAAYRVKESALADRYRDLALRAQERASAVAAPPPVMTYAPPHQEPLLAQSTIEPVAPHLSDALRYVTDQRLAADERREALRSSDRLPPRHAGPAALADWDADPGSGSTSVLRALSYLDSRLDDLVFKLQGSPRRAHGGGTYPHERRSASAEKRASDHHVHRQRSASAAHRRRDDCRGGASPHQRHRGKQDHRDVARDMTGGVAAEMARKWTQVLHLEQEKMRLREGAGSGQQQQLTNAGRSRTE